MHNCDICNSLLTSPESIKRHKGSKCYIEYLEKQLEVRDLQIEMLKRLLTRSPRRLLKTRKGSRLVELG